MHLGIDATKIIENYGLKRIWIGDDIGGPRDIYTYTAKMLSVSHNVEVGIGIVSPFYHNITTIARSSASLTENYGERLRLGLGVGGLTLLKERGIMIKQIVEGINTAVETLRKIFQGEEVTLHSQHFSLDSYRIWDSYPIPIYLGVRGPKLLKLASQIADGVIISAPKPYINEMMKLFTPSKITRKVKIVGWLPTIMVEHDDKRSVKYLVNVVGTVAADTPNKVLEIAGLDVERVEKIRQEVSLRRWDHVAKLTDEDFTEAFVLYGSPSELVDKLINWSKKSGIDEVVFGPPYGKTPKKAIERIAQEWNTH
jgi:5,10-methylenetetrahydromethanopterin reductase